MVNLVVLKYLRIWILFSLFFCVAQLMAEEPYELRRKTQTLNVGMNYFPDNLDPIKIWNYQEIILTENLYRPLMRVSERGIFESDLALRWTIEPDGKTYTFHLDPKAKFDDGTPVLASDMAWSLSRHFWPDPDANEGFLSGALEGADSVKVGERVSGIQVIDDHTLKVKLKNFYPSFFYFLASGEFGAIPEKRFDGRHPIGSGGIHSKYNPASNSWLFSRESVPEKALSKLKTIRVSRVQDAADAQRQMASGDVDVVMGFRVDQVKQISLPEGFEIKAMDALVFEHLYYNMERPLFKDIEFRRDLSDLFQTAIRHFKDPDGLTQLLPTYLSEGMMPRKYYQRSLREISAESFKLKWPNPVSLKVVLKHEFLDQATTSALTEMCKKAGITLNWSYQKNENYVQSIKTRDYDLLFAGYVDFTPDPEVAIPPLQPKNPMRYCNGDMTRFFKKIEEARSISEQSSRFQAYLGAFELFEKQYYFIPISQGKLPVVVRKQLSLRENHPYNHENLSLWAISWKDFTEG